MTATLADYIAAHEQMLGHYVALTNDLTDEQLATQSLCPDWTVRDVIVHVAAVDAVLTGWEPTTDTPPPFNRLRPVVDELTALDRASFSARVAEIVEARLDDLRRRDPGVIDLPSVTPAGVATYGRFLQIRVFDQWVHARDIATPLGVPAPAPSGFPAEAALTEVVAALGYVVGKKIGLPDGMSIVFRVAGGATAEVAVAVDGRAAVVPVPSAPDVEVTADVDTFVMLACGRIDPEAEIAAGHITWSGNDELGARAARNLRYTM